MIGQNPTDRGKLGTKRHLLTDQRGISLYIVITATNTHDMKAATETLDRTVVERPLKNQNLYLDKGYDYPEIERIYQKKIRATYSSQRSRKRMDKDRVCNEEIGCRKNKLLAQQI
jgi:hypothetical protein